MKKQKYDGNIDMLYSDCAKFLVMRGDYTRDQIFNAAVSEGYIAQEDDFWLDERKVEYYQCHYKTVPDPDGWGTMNYPRDTPCRGSYFVSVLQY